MGAALFHCPRPLKRDMIQCIIRHEEVEMAKAPAAGGQSPIVDLNTTPLIDVMLVLLVMFIITVPIQTHAVKLDLPVPCADCPQVDARKNELAITKAGEFLWNGAPITQAQLRHQLDAVGRMRPQPELHFRPDAEARYEIVDHVLVLVKRAGVTTLGFVGNERYADR